mgnify:FL=1
MEKAILIKSLTQHNHLSEMATNHHVTSGPNFTSLYTEEETRLLQM